MLFLTTFKNFEHDFFSFRLYNERVEVYNSEKKKTDKVIVTRHKTWLIDWLMNKKYLN